MFVYWIKYLPSIISICKRRAPNCRSSLEGFHFRLKTFTFCFQGSKDAPLFIGRKQENYDRNCFLTLLPTSKYGFSDHSLLLGQNILSGLFRGLNYVKFHERLRSTKDLSVISLVYHR